MKCSWQTFLSPLKGQCQYQALLGLFQTTRLTGGFDFRHLLLLPIITLGFLNLKAVSFCICRSHTQFDESVYSGLELLVGFSLFCRFKHRGFSQFECGSTLAFFWGWTV